MKQTPEYRQTAGIQKLVADLLIAKGCAVIPICEMDGAPLLNCPGGQNIVLPDLFACRRGRSYWIEVKAKTQPGFMDNLGCWTHGLDFGSLLEYEAFESATGLPLFVFIHEELTPSGGLPASHPDFKWLEGAVLYERLESIRKIGWHSPNWPHPNGVNSRDGRGGWTWRRDQMVPFRQPRVHTQDNEGDTDS